MSIQVQSTTEKPEALAALNSELAKEKVEDKKEKLSASDSKESGETTEESEASDITDESEDSESKDGNEDDSSEESRDQDQKPKANKGFKKRIDKLTSRLSAKDQEVEYWKAEALKSKKSADAAAPEKAIQKEAGVKPKADDFETHESYVEALTDWKVQQYDKDREEKQNQKTVKTEFEKRISAHQERVKEFSEKHEDFLELMEDADDVEMSIAVREVVLDSDNGPELMYELAKNKAEYKRICALPPLAAARELGKFEARINKTSSESSAEEPKTTKAPKPITPVVGNANSGSGKKTIFDPNLSQSEYEALREKQRSKKWA